MNVQLVHKLQLFLDSNKEAQQLEIISGIRSLYFQELWGIAEGSPGNRFITKLRISMSQDISDCVNLKTLVVTGGDVNFLPPGLNRLEIRMDGNKIELPELPSSLKRLHLNNVDVTNLHDLKLPECLSTLIINNTKLTKLPKIPCGLRELRANYNQLTELPELPKGLKFLAVGSNKLTTIPELPEGLTSLGCQENAITDLGKIPSTLKTLICYDNRLTRIDIPEGLQYIDCQNNPLVIRYNLLGK